MSDLLEVTTPEPHVRLVRLNNPQTRNALCLDMRRAICEAITDAAESEEIRCIVLSGSETVFSAGADVRAVVDSGPMDIARAELERYWLPLRQCRKPIIAAVNGHAIGGGCELAMLADLIIAGEGAVFAQPEIRLGIMPGSGATQRLPRVAGKFRALRVLLTGTPFSAREALEMGLLSELVPDAEVLPTALKTAQLIARQSTEAVRRIKEVVLTGADLPLDAALLLERQAMQVLFDTEEQTQYMRAHLETRQRTSRGEEAD